MDLTSILKPESIRCHAEAGSKKHALDVLSEILARASGTASAGEVLEGLAARERLGSTGLGESLAMPHARLPGLEHNVGAFLKLAEAVDFDSPDGQPVDLLFGLLVPEESDGTELKKMRELVQRLRDPVLQRQLRATNDPQLLYRLLTDSLTAVPQSISA